MGRIKSTLIKRTAKELIRQVPFTESFGNNKQLLKDTMPSKKIRNKVAGYLVQLRKMKSSAQVGIHVQQM